MITDSYSYTLQALAFAQGDAQYLQSDYVTSIEGNLLKAPYSLGNSFYISLFVILFGKKGIFISSLFAVLGSGWILDRLLKRDQLNRLSIALFFCSLPVLFFCRSLMSGIPSLLLISGFLYLYSAKNKGTLQWFTLGFITGLSAWFRESNIILLAPFVIHLFIENRKSSMPILLGGIVGLLIKFLSSWFIYGDFWFVSASSGFNFYPKYLILYLFITIVLIPGGLFIPLLVARSKAIVYSSAIFGFIIFYSLYDYSAVEYSDFIKGSLLTSRFMLPIIPVLVLALSEIEVGKNLSQKLLKYLFVPLSLILIPLSQYGFHKLFSAHEKAAYIIAEKYQNEHVIYDQSGLTNIIRYINPLSGDWKSLADVQSLKDKGFRPKKNDEQFHYVILSMSIGNDEKQVRSDHFEDLLDEYQLTKVDSISIDSDNWLIVYQLD